MNKLTKGALGMVLVGAVTFSVTNALLAEHSSKTKSQATALSTSGHQKTTDHTNQSHKQLTLATNLTNLTEQNIVNDINSTEKTEKDQIATMEVKDVPSTVSQNIVALQNGNESNNNIAAIPIHSAAISAPTKTTGTTTTSTKTMTNSNTSSPNSSTITKGTSTKSASPTAPPANTTTTTSTATTTNHGQQVSQTAKQNGTSHQDSKVNNGKKKGIL